jgi:hypothetical protein
MGLVWRAQDERLNRTVAVNTRPRPSTYAASSMNWESATERERDHDAELNTLRTEHRTELNAQLDRHRDEIAAQRLERREELSAERERADVAVRAEHRRETEALQAILTGLRTTGQQEHSDPQPPGMPWD